MNKAIEIEEMRISSNGEYLEFIINCPADYLFTEFTILVNGSENVYSIADSLFYTHTTSESGEDVKTYITETDNRFTGQVPVSLFGVSGPEIYNIKLEAVHLYDCMPEGYRTSDYAISEDGHIMNKYGYAVLDTDKCTPTLRTDYYLKNGIVYDSTNTEVKGCGKTIFVDNDGLIYECDSPSFIFSDCVEHLTEADNRPKEVLEASAWISDVSQAYLCLMDDILSLQSTCTDKEAQDRVIRNYLMLYAHQEALRLGYLDEATKWFDLIANCFTGTCGKPGRNVNVNCGCRINSAPHSANRGSSCGCHR